jgi:CMP-N,N'-diacetyllegionaminic acid synthase
MKKILGIIPARGGSKGIPGKNIRLLGGKPLIYYSIHSAIESNIIDRLILTTDSSKIAEIGKNMGAEVPFLRPPNLAQDDTPMRPVIEHVVKFVDDNGWIPDIILLLQPTAPLRQPQHIQLAVEMLLNLKCDSVVSVIEVPQHYSPDFVLKFDDGKLKPFIDDGEKITRRQDTRPAFSRDGTIYAFWHDVLLKKRSIYGDDCRPLLISQSMSCNLDTIDDWEDAERKMKSNKDYLLSDGK